MNRTLEHSPLPIPIDPHFSPSFYAELWGISVSTVVRWFQELEGEEKGPEQVSLIEAALEIGKLSASYGIKKITVEGSDGSEFFFHIGDQT